MIGKIIEKALEEGISDIHITVGKHPAVRIDGDIEKWEDEKIVENTDLLKFLNELEIDPKEIEVDKKLDCAFTMYGRRFRNHIYYTMGKLTMSIRVLSYVIPELIDLGLPESVRKICSLKQGLVLVVGPTGSGKSTTMASILNEINKTKKKKILTIEEPIEYLLPEYLSEITQRQVGTDTPSFGSASVDAMRADPDIILLGELRDLDTIQHAITLAETGHLVISTLHTNSTAETIDRVIDVFPESKQQHIRMMLSQVLEVIISQRLVKKPHGGRVALCEIMTVQDSIRSSIREKKSKSFYDDALRSNREKGCLSIVDHAVDLHRAGLVGSDEVIHYLDKNQQELFKSLTSK